MTHIDRRTMLAASTAAGVTLLTNGFSNAAASTPKSGCRKFTMDLTGGAIGVRADQLDSIELAAKYGFESVSPNIGFLASLDDAGRKDLAATMKQRNIVWGAAGLPVDFRKDDATFQDGLKKLPALARGLQQAGVTRVSTWLMPCHDELTYVTNFRQHASRLRECVKILGDHGQRFGMEYVGPKTLWASKRHSFIHSMAETKELIA